MVKKISTANAEHYTWAEVCNGWHLVMETGVDAEFLVVSEPHSLAIARLCSD